MNFCRRCGSALTHLHDHVYTCTNGHTLYANSSPTVGVFFVSADNRQVLLATRGQEPHKDMLDALGGFVDANETPEAAAVRELTEEVALSLEEYEPLTYLTSDFDTYPYQDEELPFVSLLFYSRLRTDRKLKASDDVASIDWYPLREIDFNRLHAADIRTGVRKLQDMFIEKGAA